MPVRNIYSRLIGPIATGFFLVLAIYIGFISPPVNFPKTSVVKIEAGGSAVKISDDLAEKGIIRSSKFFIFFLTAMGKSDSILAGDYVLDGKENAITIVLRLTRGDFRLTPIRVTIPEGTPSFDIPKYFVSFYNFDASRFEKIAAPKEGYLFPDTYDFNPNSTADEVVDKLTRTFAKKIEPLEKLIGLSGKTLDEIVIMASIIEEEAVSSDDRRLISGILWKRLSLGMPLQVDAPFAYIGDKNTYELTLEDLRKDSPYNTYTRPGLTPGPISNPGLDSITAALEPKNSPHLYYLSDPKGTVYYASTFEQHKKNKEKYLR